MLLGMHWKQIQSLKGAGSGVVGDEMQQEKLQMYSGLRAWPKQNPKSECVASSVSHQC